MADVVRQWKIRVRGKVQGVFFRVSAREKAQELGLSGWVKNEDDGSVVIAVEGEERLLENFLEWAREGSELAQVEEAVVEAKNQAEGLAGFSVQ